MDNKYKNEKTCKRIESPTPNGSYAIMYFYDKNGNSCTEEEAVKGVIAEFDENDKMVYETVGYFDKREQKPETPKNYFCSICGEIIGKNGRCINNHHLVTIDPEETVRICKSCHSSIAMSDKYCRICGAKQY